MNTYRPIFWALFCVLLGAVYILILETARLSDRLHQAQADAMTEGWDQQMAVLEQRKKHRRELWEAESERHNSVRHVLDDWTDMQCPSPLPGDRYDTVCEIELQRCRASEKDAMDIADIWMDGCRKATRKLIKRTCANECAVTNRKYKMIGRELRESNESLEFWEHSALNCKASKTRIQ